jgi:LssY C-terminus
MRILPRVSFALALFCIPAASGTAFACDQLPAGQPLWIRLAAPVSTYIAKPGDAVYAVLTQDLVCDSEIVLPMGSRIEGMVRSRRKVGWGIRHETAALELEFHRASAEEITLDFTARVEEVENARERVHNGVIQGIRSSDTFQGSINSRLIHLPTYNPYSDAFLIAYKVTFPIFPEPEIYYPAGTDIRLRTTTPVSVPSAIVTAHDVVPASPPQSDQIEKLVGELPTRVTTTKAVDADLLNIVFLGSEEQVRAAFIEAAWHSADSNSRRTFLRNVYAVLNNSGYPEEPMMTFLLNGKPEDMNWQKGLNSYGRRDHLRIWRWTSPTTDAPVWISASTRDTGATLSIKYKGFVHHIAPDIDDERSTVIRDLNFAGCVKSVSYIPRPGMPTAMHNAVGDAMFTDGSVAVVELQDCRSANPQLDSTATGGAFKPGNLAFRYIRKQILTFRNDIWRANIIYGTYDAGRRVVMALRHKPAAQPQEAAKPDTVSPSSVSVRESMRDISRVDSAEK